MTLCALIKALKTSLTDVPCKLIISLDTGFAKFYREGSCANEIVESESLGQVTVLVVYSLGFTIVAVVTGSWYSSIPISVSRIDFAST